MKVVIPLTAQDFPELVTPHLSHGSGSRIVDGTGVTQVERANQEASVVLPRERHGSQAGLVVHLAARVHGASDQRCRLVRLLLLAKETPPPSKAALGTTEGAFLLVINRRFALVPWREAPQLGQKLNAQVIALGHFH